MTRITVIITWIQYLFSVLFHKYCILIVGIGINKILRSTSYRVSYKRLFLHDLSKFSRAEFFSYADFFYGTKMRKEEFKQAWIHHVEHNDHHAEHFIENYSRLIDRLDQESNLIIRPMPDEAIVEMIVDQIAASVSYDKTWPKTKKKDGWNWMKKNYESFRLHPETKVKFTILLMAIGFQSILPASIDWLNIIEKSSLNDRDKNKLFQLKYLIEKNN